MFDTQQSCQWKRWSETQSTQYSRDRIRDQYSILNNCFASRSADISRDAINIWYSINGDTVNIWYSTNRDAVDIWHSATVLRAKALVGSSWYSRNWRGNLFNARVLQRLPFKQYSIKNTCLMSPLPSLRQTQLKCPRDVVPSGNTQRIRDTIVITIARSKTLNVSYNCNDTGCSISQEVLYMRGTLEIN